MYAWFELPVSPGSGARRAVSPTDILPMSHNVCLTWPVCCISPLHMLPSICLALTVCLSRLMCTEGCVSHWYTTHVTQCMPILICTLSLSLLHMSHSVCLTLTTYLSRFMCTEGRTSHWYTTHVTQCMPDLICTFFLSTPDITQCMHGFNCMSLQVHVYRRLRHPVIYDPCHTTYAWLDLYVVSLLYMSHSVCLTLTECLYRFMCAEGRVSRWPYTGYCVYDHERCDNYVDCDDASDEQGCSNTCAHNEFRCENITAYQVSLLVVALNPNNTAGHIRMGTDLWLNGRFEFEFYLYLTTNLQ